MPVVSQRPSALPGTGEGLFADDSILPDPPLGPDGSPLPALHDREYRVRAYRLDAGRLLLRGAVRDQKPPGLYVADDPEPLTIHHMQLDLVIALPSMEIEDASLEFQMYPNLECPAIVDRYRELIGLSVARGFTHQVRQLFGGPRGCTHSTALLQAMAPVAVQYTYSAGAFDARAHGEQLISGSTSGAGPERREQLLAMNRNTCHVWADDSGTIERLRTDGPSVPVFLERRLERLGRDAEGFDPFS